MGDIKIFLNQFNVRINEVEEMLTNNHIWKQRLVDVGVVSYSNCEEWGFSGVMLRGSGVAWDLRLTQPYEIYKILSFEIPIGTSGDCYDRYLIRIQEMRESCKIIDFCLNNVTKGTVQTTNKKLINPSKSTIKKSMEALIHHFKYFTKGFVVPSGEIYLSTEAPKGEFGVNLISDGSNKPYRCKIKAPGFNHLQGLDFMSRGHMIADVVTIIGTQDIVFGEVDR